MNPIEIRPWTPESNELLIPLFSEVFKKAVDRKMLETKFSSALTGKAPIAHLALDAGRAVGFYCLLPARFRQGDQEYWGGHSVDTMVLRAYRKDGLFGKLMRASIEAAQAGGMDFLYGCGVDSAIPSFLKKGWELMYRMKMLATPAASWPRYRALGKLGLSPRLGLKVPETWTATTASLRRDGLSPVQDADLYRWKAELAWSGWREFPSGWAWLRPGRDLWVGDVRLKGEFVHLWAELTAFARRKGFPLVIFQASPAVWERIGLPAAVPLQESWQTLAFRFPRSPDVGRLELVFGDVDTF